MALEVADFALLIGMTTAITTATTTLATYKLINDARRDICNQISTKIEAIHKRLNSIAIRVGIIEGSNDGCPNDLK